MSSITVSGMSCNRCTAAVTKAMQAIPDAGDVQVDLASGKATWNGKADANDMADAVRNQGFGVEK